MNLFGGDNNYTLSGFTLEANPLESRVALRVSLIKQASLTSAVDVATSKLRLVNHAYIDGWHNKVATFFMKDVGHFRAFVPAHATQAIKMLEDLGSIQETYKFFSIELHIDAEEFQLAKKFKVVFTGDETSTAIGIEEQVPESDKKWMLLNTLEQEAHDNYAKAVDDTLLLAGIPEMIARGVKQAVMLNYRAKHNVGDVSLTNDKVPLDENLKDRFSKNHS